MLSGLGGASPLSDEMSESTLERARGEKALIVKSLVQSNTFLDKPGMQAPGSLPPVSYSDKNGNDINKRRGKGRKTFAFWTLVVLLFVLAVGNLVLTFTILGVLHLGQGMESMEFVPEHNMIKFFGRTDLDHLYKRDGLLESFRDSPMSVTSENGSVMINLQTKQSHPENKLKVNSSGIFLRGVDKLEIRDPHIGDIVFSTASPTLNIPHTARQLNTKIASTKRIASPVDEPLNIRSDASVHLRGAEGTHMESKELLWSADQDIYLKSVNGSVILSGKEGVFIDVKNIPIAMPHVKTDNQKYTPPTGQFKVCVCMPMGKLFRIAVPTGQKTSCSHVNMTADHNPCL